MKEFIFTPLVEFSWYRDDVEKLVGIYYPGMTYNCTKQPRHDALRKKCEQWKQEGLIKTSNDNFITLEINDGSST